MSNSHTSTKKDIQYEFLLLQKEFLFTLFYGESYCWGILIYRILLIGKSCKMREIAVLSNLQENDSFLATIFELNWRWLLIRVLVMVSRGVVFWIVCVIAENRSSDKDLHKLLPPKYRPGGADHRSRQHMYWLHTGGGGVIEECKCFIGIYITVGSQKVTYWFHVISGQNKFWLDNISICHYLWFPLHNICLVHLSAILIINLLVPWTSFFCK